MQRKLGVFRDWYNVERTSQALCGLTPDEAWSGASLPENTAVRAHDPQPRFEVRRRKYGGDPHLPVLDIEVDWPEAA